ncbi:pyrimidine 5'-nucleotidase-domain-containing protein [Mycotypha africana]|uniref:pyrimidine 5'-nucleotidase-domain-containing protein n=1 Tax=Mycotypha africana TaxID=64632 RepID=UPI002300ACDC|nr:pyrimidine 5'-nucleotidase-domain-containing protein [Mycotypha africana]KAI8968450.1 pyrimidine 5'-nucleotidase-domain-containing protein [Mycotypha africana]
MSRSVQAKALVETLLTIPTVRIQNVPRTTEKLQKVIQDGKHNLHFISDFDMTMTRHWIRNRITDALERNSSSHGIPARSSIMTQEYKDETHRIYNKYYPIEIDQTMTFEEKVPYMMTWWKEAHASIVQQKLKKQDLQEMVKQVSMELRSGLDRVLAHCRHHSVPFLVFSAGIGDLIEEILRQADLYYENMHVVSNMMVFDKDNVCIDFKEPLIHVFNKSEFQLETSPYHRLIEERRNVILMGDSLGDLQMSQGLKHDLCLNIGFLNHDIKSLEPAYMAAFDIVIEGDANMNPVMEILEQIQ